MRTGNRHQTTGNRKKAQAFGFALVAMFLSLSTLAQAQKIPRIAYLTALSTATDASRIEALRQGLRDLGYVEGKNIIVEIRSTGGSSDGLAALAAELVRNKVDIIVSGGPTATRPAKEATSTIPIVMAQDSDPVSNGFVASLARPGGNITGLSTHYPEISAKQVELLKEMLPRLAHLAVLGASTNPGNAQSLRQTELAGAGLGVQIQYFDAQSPKDIESAFRVANKEHRDAVLVLNGPIFNSHRKSLIETAAKNRLPTMYNSTVFVENGGLMTYGVERSDLYRRAATYVDKILKGAKPADLPVEQPTKFELVINLNAAKQIGLVIPPNVLARADRVIR